MLPTIKQIREANGGLDNLTDFEIAQHQHQQYKAYVPDFNRFAQMVGVDAGTKWGNRLGASIDSAQASLAGVGESALDIEGLRGVRLKNSLDARNSRQFARSQGAIMESGQVDGVGSALEYVGGLAVDTAPQMLSTLGAGALGTLAAGPVGGAAAAGSVGYSFALGDILENQREQTGGRTDVGSASALAVPYALVDTFTGAGGTLLKLGKGTLPKAGLNLLDKTLDGVQGIKGAALRTGVNVGKVPLAEGVGETFQEGMNQLGRMAVDPNETFLNDRSAEAFKESFIGGAALGGAIGGATGGWRRSDSYQPPIDANGGVNLLNGQPLNPPAPVVNPGANAPLADVINQRVGLDLNRQPTKGYESAFKAAQDEPSGVIAVDPATGQEYEMTQAQYLEREAAQRNDAFAQQLAAEQAALAEDKAKIEARSAVREEAKGLGITGSKGADLYLELKQALEDGVISEADFRETRVQLGERKNNQVAKFIKAAYAQADATQTAKAQMEADAIAAVQARPAEDDGTRAMEKEWAQSYAQQAGEVFDEAAWDREYDKRAEMEAAVQAAPEVDLAPAEQAWESARERLRTLPDAIRNSIPAMPVFGDLTPEQKTQVADLAAKDQFTLAAADTVLNPPKKTAGPAPRPKSEEEYEFRRSLGQHLLHLRKFGASTKYKAMLEILQDWMGVDVDANGELTPREHTLSNAQIGEMLKNSKSGKVGVTRQQVHKYIKATLEAIGAPKGTNVNKLRQMLGFQLSGTDLETINRNATTTTKPEDGTGSMDGAFEGAFDQFDPETGVEIEGGAPRSLEDDVGDGETEGYEVDLEDAIRQVREAERIQNAKTGLEKILDGDLKSGAVLESDIAEAQFAFESMGTRKKWENLSTYEQATAVRYYANARESGDPSVTENQREFNEAQKPGNTAAQPDTGTGAGPRLGSAQADGRAQQEPDTPEAADGRGTTTGEPVAEGQRPASPAPVVVVKKKRTIQKPVEAEAQAEPAVAEPAVAEPAPRRAPRNTTSGSVAAWVAGQPTTAPAGPGFTAAGIVSQPAPAEQAVIEETVGVEVAQLPEPQVQTLEAHYGAKRGTVDFLVKVKEDIVAFAVNGAQAIAAKVRHIIRKLYAAVVAGAFIFNPTTLSNVGLVSSDFEGWTVQDIQAAVPQSVRSKMSPGAQQAYATILPSVRAQLQRENKLMLVVDKPTARMFVFKPDGTPLLDKKILLGATKGDLYKGNTDVKANRITPAGLFTMGLRDARRGPGEARTAGEYDTGTVFVLDKAIDGEYSVTLFHSVWTKEGDAKQRLNALKKDGPADSRYSFGCINVDKETYLRLLNEHGGQMDGAALFIVPENQKGTAEFLKGDTAQNKSGADELTRTPLKPATEVVRAPRFSKGDRNSKVTPTGTKTGNTVLQVKDAINKLFPQRVRDLAYQDRVKVHQTEAEAVEATGGKISADEMVGAQGFVDPTDDRIVHLVADNLPKGRELGVLLHEVGVHVGLTKKFKGAFKVLADQVQSWADAPRGSLERRVYEAAKARVDSANPDAAERSEELVAYAAEEAVSEGVMPDARGVNERVAKWLQSALNHMRNMVRSFLGFQPDVTLTPQDLVDFAYGAARDTLGDRVVERAAMQGAPVTDTQLLQYYTKSADIEDIYDSTQILLHVAPGQEIINWGPESTYGPHQGITTAGYVYARVAGVNPEADPGAVELEEVVPHPDTGIQVFAMMLTSDAVMQRALAMGANHMPAEQTLASIEAWYAEGGMWSIVVRGPQPDTLLYRHLESLGQVKMSEPDMNGDRWSTLTGIADGDTQELLTEFRRRLTRALGGEVPGAEFTRATGAAVGKEGEYSPATVRRRFSKAAPSVAQQLGPQYAKAETALTRAIGDLKTAAIKYGAFTRDLIDQAAKLMPAARKYLEHYEAVATDRTRMEQQVDAVLERFAALNTHERTRVNEVVRTSTMSREWAFKPDWLPNAKYDENSDVARAFRALTPAQRGVIQDVFRHGHDTLAAMQKAVKDNVNSEFDVLIKGFRDAGNMDEATKAEARKAKALTEFSSMLEMNGNWPYAPLRRFGDHVVVAKSAAYRAAELADDKAQIKALEADENHYYVEFFESRGDARKAVDNMQATGKYDQVENFNKGNANEQLYGGRDVFNAFRRLRGLVNETEGASLSEPANATINKLMNDLYLSLLGERSARQAERNRKNTAGADRDMMRAFATKGRADAHFIASLRFGGQVQEDLLKMKKEADEGPNGGTRELRREYFNEILARHTMQMDFQSTPVVDKVMATSSFWQLLFNPAYYLQNVMQPWVMSLPMLAGKHGYGKSWSALARAYRDLGPLIKDGAFTKGDYDALPADVRAIVKDLAARGRIEITLEHDLGQWNSNVDDKAYNRAFTWVTKGLRGVNSRLEMLNRLATGIAAARLEGVGNAKNATDYADRVIIGTHGDYNAFNAPRLMRTPLGRMATQFRKFQLIQITMYTKLISDALKGASPTERAVARRVLAYNMGHMAVLGGAMGLPGFQLFSMVLGSIFGDDDEPDDAEATLRRVMGNGPLTDALTRGVPNMLGVDLSSKVGSGNMLSLFPYSDWDIESRSGYQNLLAAAAGPFVGGLMPKWADAVGNAKQGDYYKALEKVLPGALGNAIKGTRFAVDGVTTTRGVQAMSADEITWVDGLFQAVGLPTSTITDRNFRSGAEYKASKFFDEKVSQVKKDYVEAFQDNDTDAMAEARQEWLDMQATRKRLGLTVQPLSQLIKAPRERMKRDRMAVGGVAADKETQGFVRNLME